MTNPDNTDNTTAPAVSLRTLMRRPLSTLRPSPSVRRAADRCAGVLRHPRSRIQVTPGWQAPSLQVALPTGPAQVFLSRHRVSPVMWRRLTGSGALDYPPPAVCHLVTLTAFATPSELSGSERNMTVDVHSLFRRTLLPPDCADHPRNRELADCDCLPWLSEDVCGEPTSDGRRLEWTWHALTHGEPGRSHPHSHGHGLRTRRDNVA
ncbi:hypothetical protein [Corynebacterium glyciniphilum]|uniref:hypothetical protein n=1 Tax=Corynebacterium glyciniphilum TaxID=1404244 RepID=UPI0011AB4429|nr:hypothetical protein [Corynebacterium glyciniphilum]